ncbi:MAG TPA: hypothetical protein VLI91_02715 [Roseiarcus sp.]|nr:hypothetical protein [Roseiarcus sp.]
MRERPDPGIRTRHPCDGRRGRACPDDHGQAHPAFAGRDSGAAAASRELREDVRQALAVLSPTAISLDAAAQAVLGIILQALAAIGEGALTEPDRSGIVRAILGAVGADRSAAEAILDRIGELERRFRGGPS